MFESTTIESQRDLLIAELKSLLYIERELADDVIPELEGMVHDPEMQQALSQHLTETRGQITNLEQCFTALGVDDVDTQKSATFDGLTADHKKIMGMLDTDNETLSDFFHAGVITKTESFEISCYESAITTAESVSAQEVIPLLTENLEQERSALKKGQQAAQKLSSGSTSKVGAGVS